MKVSIVTPVYKEEKNIPEFLKRTQTILDPMTKDYEIIFAMDPSPDQTEEVILKARNLDSRIKLLKFSRRIGQPMAVLAGLQYSAGDAVIVMDVDLQDPPELIQEMIRKWELGFDVVYAQRRSRKGETLIKRFVSYWGYKFINRVADVDIPPNTGDFRLMSRRVVSEVLRLKECHGFLRGMVALVGFKQTPVLFDRPARFEGKGHYNQFFGSLRIGLNGIVCFSNYLLSLSSQLGFVIAGCSFLIALYCFVVNLLGFHVPFHNPTLVVLVLFIGGVQLITIGILGEYIGRIYEEVKGRPRFILDKAVGIQVPSDKTRPLRRQEPEFYSAASPFPAQPAAQYED